MTCAQMCPDCEGSGMCAASVRRGDAEKGSRSPKRFWAPWRRRTQRPPPDFANPTTSVNCNDLLMPEYEFDEWVAVATGRHPQPSGDYIVVAFPSEEIRDQYLSSIEDRHDEEFRSILRTFLGGSRTVEPSDSLHLSGLRARHEIARSQAARASDLPTLSEYDRRVIAYFAGASATPTWEGLTWVVDLLPHFPNEALGAVHAYLLAHAQVLPDLRLTSLSDAADLIRSRHITRGEATLEVLHQVLLGLSSRDFEFLVARLYRGMGYDVQVTPAQKDGGKDVIAERPHEVIYIECKNWSGRVDSDVIAGLVGRVESHRVTRGIVVGTSGFTTGHASATAVAAESPARIALISGADLIEQLNETLGGVWHLRLDRLLQEERAAQYKAIGSA